MDRLPAASSLPLKRTAYRTARRQPPSRTDQLGSPGVAGARVLISDEHYKHTLAIVRHLGQMGAHVAVLAGSKNSLACRSRYCSEVIVSRTESVEQSVITILQTIQQTRFDLVLPVSYPMTLALARRQEQIVRYTHLELAKHEIIELAANKTKMVNLAGKIGVPAPKTIDLDDLRGRVNEFNFPVVIKPGKESPGHPPVMYAKSAKQLESILAARARRTNLSAGDYLVQEFIPGYGCGFFATYQDGVCKRVFMHRRIREYPATGGVSSCAESFYDHKLEAYGRRMLDALEWHGVAMVEFRHDSRDGEYKLMEINPKFWGSLDLALAAGANFPEDLCQMALGQRLSFTGDYNRSLRFQWPLAGHGDLFHLWTRPASLFAVAFDLLNPRVKSNVWIRDFGPNAQELSGLAGILSRGKRT